MLMVSDMLRAARQPDHADRIRRRFAPRFGQAADVPAVVVWNVCRHCNMSCPHCYAAAVDTPSPRDLSTDEGRALLDTLAEAGVSVVIFSGGEPLLREDLFDLLEHARGRGLQAQLSTNGVLIDGPAAARLRDAGVGYVGVSIDGDAGFNDAYRGLAGGHERATAALRHVAAAGLRAGLRVTVTAGNAQHVPGLLALAGDAGARRFYVSHLVYSGRGHRLVEGDLGRERTRELLLSLFARAEELLDEGKGPDVVTGSNDSDAILLLGHVERRHGPAAAAVVEGLLRARGGNSAGERILNVDHAGRVHPDQFWQAAILGDVRQDDFAAILRHPLRDQLRRREELLRGRCGECRWKALCRGSHRERALAVHGDPWASDPACVLTDAEVLADRVPSSMTEMPA